MVLAPLAALEAERTLVGVGVLPGAEAEAEPETEAVAALFRGWQRPALIGA